MTYQKLDDTTTQKFLDENPIETLVDLEDPSSLDLSKIVKYTNKINGLYIEFD